MKFTDDKEQELEELQAGNWDKFYSIHQNKFFKDRHWLPVEFPELMDEIKPDLRIFELGSGVGNSKNCHN